jgi:hypothetical protein
MMKVKALVNGAGAYADDSFLFADKVIHETDWAGNVRMAVCPGKRSEA